MDAKIAAAYVRVSTEDQTEYSPDAQLRELRDYASAHQMILDDRFIYADEGISGRKADRRPGFQEMIRAAKGKEHPFDVILVHKFDRFARSREDSVVYKAMLKRAGVEVISIKEPLAEGSYAGVMEAIYESFAEAYSINLAQEVKKGMTERALRGQIQTAPPYGYMLADLRQQGSGNGSCGATVSKGTGPPVPRGFVPHPVEAEYVREIFRRFAGGEGLFPIAKWLNEAGQRTHRGNPFENRTVEYILRNPVYVGIVRWNPTGKTRRDFDHPNLILAQGTHTPLISPELWEACRHRMAEVKAKWQPHSRPDGDRRHWLCGIVRCAACGATLIWSKPCYMKCNHYVRGRCIHSQHIRASLLEQALMDRLKAHAGSGAPPAARLIRLSGQRNPAVTTLRRRLETLEKKQQRLLEAYLNGADIPIPQYNAMTAALKQEAEAIQAKLAAEDREKVPTVDEQSAGLLEDVARTLETLESETATMEQKHDAATSLIEASTFDKSSMTLTITYRLTV